MASPIISVNYDSLQKVAEGFANQQREVQRINRDLTQVVDVLRRGGWVATAANQFYRTIEKDVFVRLQHLNTALGHAEAATREIITVFQHAEQEASGVLNGGGGNGGGRGAVGGASAGGAAGVGGGSAPKAITEQSWFALNSDRDGGWNGAPPGVAKAIVVNGIQNDVGDLQNLMQGASKELGGVPVLGIYNATGGKGALSMGMVRDLGQSLADKFQAQVGFRPGPDNAAVNSLIEAIKATNGRTEIVAHSQGGAITAAALRTLSDQGFDLTHLKVITMGSAEFHFPDGPQYEHRVHANDLVPMIAGGRLEYYAFDPISLAKDVITGHVKIFPTLNPLTAHGADNYFKDF